MIRDFLLALTIIVVVELGGRLLIEMNHFQREDREATEVAAERLAQDVKDIMLNSGGPVAARTVYPIIRRNHIELGLEIAIVPSEITVQSIQKTFGFEPNGISPQWSKGRHHEATAVLEAEEFCVRCHVTAAPGDELGYVTVRSYRAARMATWWREVRMVSVVGMANVILHTIVLFFLLRLRMEPLLRLRATVARLAKGRLDLSQRAVAKSSDEFGELATDLNHFLDRIGHLVQDLNGVLGQVGAVNERLTQVSARMGEQLEALRARAQSAIRQAYEIRHSERVGQARHALARLNELGETLMELARDIQADTHYQGEIRVLEERMRAVSESGRQLLDRLTVGSENGDAPEEE
jgi:methyl-accepting chemotaxis protein